jgi:hypothetical protein
MEPARSQVVEYCLDVHGGDCGKQHREKPARFDATMTQLLEVPHSEIKEKLDAERKSKEEKTKPPRRDASKK